MRLDHELFKIAIDPVDLLDHQRHRSVGAPPVVIELVIRTADQRRELVQVNRARGVGRLCYLLGDEAVHYYAPTSANEVTVMV